MRKYRSKLQGGEVCRVSYVTEDLLLECFWIANLSRPNNAVMIHGTMARDVNEKNHILFIYHVNNFVCGFIKGHVISANGDTAAPQARIDWMFVDSGRQRSGIGTKLIAEYENYCAGMGVKQIEVQPASTVQAKNFYAKHRYFPGEMLYTHVKELVR